MTKSDFIKLCEARWERLENLSDKDNFYDFEKEFRSIWEDLGRSVLENRVGEVPQNHRKKKG